jgi:wyosine [tRNA(Phe)-imidazoG37] synthetase (radical SAM superfamily)
LGGFVLGGIVSRRIQFSPTSRPLPARQFLGNRFVYCVVSQRAGGLSIGINMNPDKRCNFDCVYCEVNRVIPGGPANVPVAVMIAELEALLAQTTGNSPAEWAGIPSGLPFREVALSGDGEPTICSHFQEIVEAVVRLRASRHFPFFKIVLITNGTGLHLPKVKAGISVLSSRDEIWVKLDAGTMEGLERINRTQVPLEHILQNIKDLGRQRPIVIQSLFPLHEGRGPSDEEIADYAQCLADLREAGTQISLVQVYSAHRPATNPHCGHLPLRALSRIAREVREKGGVPAEVF